MKTFKVNCKLMGSAFELALVHNHEKKANELLQIGIQEIKRIETLLSEFLPHSITSQLNEKAHIKPIVIDEECFELIKRSMAISELTEGCFDITVSPLKKLYAFKNTQFEMPPQSKIQETLKSVGYSKIKLNKRDRSVYFNHPQLKISFAAIGKGYASDQVKKIWLDQNVTAGYINASGDLNAFGKKPDGAQWKIGIAHPDQQSEMMLYVPIDNASIATSGDYEQFFMFQGVRYSHNINPNNGMPLTGIKSVSVFSPSAELSDALATAIYVMGSKKGNDFVNQLPQTHAIIIDEKNEVFLSHKLNYEEANI